MIDPNNSVSEVFLSGQVNNFCSICINPYSDPVQLSCGHIFDSKCIDTWLKTSARCPLDRKVVDKTKIKNCDALVKKMKEVTLIFKFLSGLKLGSIQIKLDESVQELKHLVCELIEKREEIVSMPKKRQRGAIQPRALLLILNLPAGNKRLYPDTELSNYSLIGGHTYTIAVINKLAQYGLPCDYCFRDSEKEKTCNHPEFEGDL